MARITLGKKMHFIFCAIISVIILVIPGCNAKNQEASKNDDEELRIGFFYGGRTALIYRAFINDYFENYGVNVRLFTKNLKGNGYFTLQKNLEYSNTDRSVVFGKVTGMELINETLNGNFQGATVGEGSFIEAINQRFPIVAVAELGHNSRDKPGHGILLRKGLIVNSSKDLKGKTFASRRSGFGDKVFLREFFVRENISIGEVTIVDNIEDDRMKKLIKKRRIDGGYYHFYAIRDLVEKDYAILYRKLDWLNPELSHALLVFHKDFVKQHPDKVQKVVQAYMKRIEYEYNLSPEERMASLGKGLDMEIDYEGMGTPKFDKVPLVNITLLDEVQNLLLKYGYINEKTNIADFINNSFVETAVKK